MQILSSCTRFYTHWHLDATGQVTGRAFRLDSSTVINHNSSPLLEIRGVSHTFFLRESRFYGSGVLAKV